jgi:hypothetical protein
MIIQSELVLALHVGHGTAGQYQCPQRLMNSTHTANAPDQKRAEISAKNPASAPVFCIWMLAVLKVHSGMIINFMGRLDDQTKCLLAHQSLANTR